MKCCIQIPNVEKPFNKIMRIDIHVEWIKTIPILMKSLCMKNSRTARKNVTVMMVFHKIC